VPALDNNLGLMTNRYIQLCPGRYSGAAPVCPDRLYPLLKGTNEVGLSNHIPAFYGNPPDGSLRHPAQSNKFQFQCDQDGLKSSPADGLMTFDVGGWSLFDYAADRNIPHHLK